MVSMLPYHASTVLISMITVLTALNLTNFAADGPLPWDHIPKDRAFKSSHLAPFATNIHFQREYTFHMPAALSDLYAP